MSTKYKWICENASYQGDECLRWPWCAPNGYGVFKHYGRRQYAHRVMCELVNGPAPSPKHHASHSCGQGHKGCVNPKHLRWKTPSENQKDRAAHGTKSTWAKRGKLTYQKAQEIRALAGKIPQREIAAQYGITRSQVSWIVTGKSWANPTKGCHQEGDRWAARTEVNGREIRLGLFDTLEEAMAAYTGATEMLRRTA